MILDDRRHNVFQTYQSSCPYVTRWRIILGNNLIVKYILSRKNIVYEVEEYMEKIIKVVRMGNNVISVKTLFYTFRDP